ncbi:MAG: hypothetical protein AABY22_09435, partial [Nanoarchaeota archaeon]
MKIKKQHKQILYGALAIIVVAFLASLYTGRVKVNTADGGISLELYDKNGVLVKDLKPFVTIDVAGQTFSNVEFAKFSYKVTNNGNIPLTIKVIESDPLL